MCVCLAIAEQLDSCNCPLWRKGFAEHYWPPTHTGVATFGCSLWFYFSLSWTVFVKAVVFGILLKAHPTVQLFFFFWCILQYNQIQRVWLVYNKCSVHCWVCCVVLLKGVFGQDSQNNTYMILLVLINALKTALNSVLLHDLVPDIFILLYWTNFKGAL